MAGTVPGGGSREGGNPAAGHAAVIPDTNVWARCLVMSEVYKYQSKKKKAKTTAQSQEGVVMFVNGAIESGRMVIPEIIHKEIHGVIVHKFARDPGINVGKHKDKVLDRARKRAERIYQEFGPPASGYSQGAYERAEAAYAAIRGDDSEDVIKKKERWARTKYKRGWGELGGIRRTQPPHDNEIAPERRDTRILAAAVEAAGEGRTMLVTDDSDFTIFSAEIGSRLPVDVARPRELAGAPIDSP